MSGRRGSYASTTAPMIPARSSTEMTSKGKKNVLKRAVPSSCAVPVSRGCSAAAARYVRPSLPGSYERLFHDAGLERAVLPIRSDLDLASAVTGERLERAIGVLYLPRTERQSHYFHASLANQFDVVLHFDRTRAVEPLERSALWPNDELAETYPSGL